MNSSEYTKQPQRPIHMNASATDPLSVAIASRDKRAMDMVRAAVEHKQVLLAFQPVVQTVNTSVMAFYEGLVRILDDTGRIIPARDFIPQIEDTELGRSIDCLSLELGIQALSEQPDLRLAINMSARSIGYRRWMRILHRGLDNDPTMAERLILEITESSAITVPELVVDFMDDLKLHGITFALDDFGAGNTALRYFKDFNFDILKIDGQFTSGFAMDPDNQVLVRAMVSIARQFDMFVVAENVERQDDAQMLIEAGVDCMQGYFFGAPTVRPPWQHAKQEQARA